MKPADQVKTCVAVLTCYHLLILQIPLDNSNSHDVVHQKETVRTLLLIRNEEEKWRQGLHMKSNKKYMMCRK